MLRQPHEVWVVQRELQQHGGETQTDHFHAFTRLESAVAYIELQFGQDIYVYDPEDGTWTGPWHRNLSYNEEPIRWRWSVIQAPLRYETPDEVTIY